ncbi:MAG: OmpA family protein [Proteobacteria bacterium]|nr:OmpA family protein [Pseudomonadota bacterium]
MNNLSQQKNCCVFIPYNIVKGCIFSIVLLFTVYFYINYAEAAPLQNSSERVFSDKTANEESQWQRLDTRARITIYRIREDNNEMSKVPVNIFINNQYHTSVLPGDAALELGLCPGGKEIDFMLGKHGATHLKPQEKVEIDPPIINEGERYYYQVAVNKMGRLSVHSVPSEEAELALSNLKVQTRTLSRVLHEVYCPEVTYTSNSPRFFNRGDSLTQLSVDGRHFLRQLVKNINNEFVQVDKIVVKKYSDRNHSSITEYPFAQMRANSITTYLTNSDIASPRFISQVEVPECEAPSFGNACEQEKHNLKESLHVEVYGVMKNIHSTI